MVGVKAGHVEVPKEESVRMGQNYQGPSLQATS